MKTDKTLYIINSKLVDSLPENYEGAFIEIEVEIEFSRSEEDFHGEKNICVYEYEILSIYSCELINGRTSLFDDLTDTLHDIVVELINKTNII